MNQLIKTIGSFGVAFILSAFAAINANRPMLLPLDHGPRAQVTPWETSNACCGTEKKPRPYHRKHLTIPVNNLSDQRSSPIFVNLKGNAMKFAITCSLILATFVTTPALAQTDSMKGMNDSGMKMKDMDMQKCMNIKGMNMKGTDMKGMDAQKCKAMMPGNEEKYASKKAGLEIHKVTGVVKGVDVVKGKVVLDHEAVKSLNWPAMTMGFMVNDKKLLEKLTVGKRVNVELRKEGADYVVVAVK